ncbi:hypothetical protein RJ639_021704 [Escallonia herrerae]|uniref:CCHC-type domain-containing protein n=1 Tax=Escallonia herrerae TaxID=1293975 RepID=A0AA88V5J4_9ASTE|nr:hypothetical protein RJ639_021704 [Escallonia herrerae]
MIAKNFKKFIRFKRNGGRRQQNVSNEEKLCYKCHKPGHMKMDCPIYKREKKERRDVWERVKRRQLSKKKNKEKEKAMNAEHTPTWSDFDSSDEDGSGVGVKGRVHGLGVQGSGSGVRFRAGGSG